MEAQMDIDEVIVRSIAQGALAGKGCPLSYGDRVIDALLEAGYQVMPAEKNSSRWESGNG